jgi:hypothetical protein
VVSLTERTAIIRQELKRLERVRALATQASHFAKRAEELQSAATALAPVGAAYLLLRQTIDTTSLHTEIAGKQWNLRFRELRDRCAKEPDAVLDPVPGQDARNIFLNPLKQLPQKWKASLQARWTEWAQAKVPKIGADVLAVLGAVPGMASKITKVRMDLESADRLSANLPMTPAEVAQFDRAVDQARAAWQELTGDGVPKEVLEFLRVAAQGPGAKLEQMTPLVEAWLRSHGLLASLRIRIS